MAEEVLLVLGAESELVEEALARSGPDGEVVVVDPVAAELESIYRRFHDARVSLLIGDADVLPLPDGSVDAVVGGEGAPELARVLR